MYNYLTLTRIAGGFLLRSAHISVGKYSLELNRLKPITKETASQSICRCFPDGLFFLHQNWIYFWNFSALLHSRFTAAAKAVQIDTRSRNPAAAASSRLSEVFSFRLNIRIPLSCPINCQHHLSVPRHCRINHSRSPWQPRKIS